MKIDDNSRPGSEDAIWIYSNHVRIQVECRLDFLDMRAPAVSHRSLPPLLTRGPRTCRASALAVPLSVELLAATSLLLIPTPFPQSCGCAPPSPRVPYLFLRSTALPSVTLARAGTLRNSLAFYLAFLLCSIS
ncbi:hypothetical protein Tco_0886665 [Tanacetum coccineum]